MEKVKVVNMENDGFGEITIKLNVEFVYQSNENTHIEIVDEIKKVVNKYSL